MLPDVILFLTGISDNHGYGYATAVWNAMRIPGWQKMDPNQLEQAVLAKLREGFTATQVLERVIDRPGNTMELVLSPVRQCVICWRSLQPWQAIIWLVWIGLWVAIKNLKNGRQA